MYVHTYIFVHIYISSGLHVLCLDRISLTLSISYPLRAISPCICGQSGVIFFVRLWTVFGDEMIACFVFESC